MQARPRNPPNPNPEIRQELRVQGRRLTVPLELLHLLRRQDSQAAGWPRFLCRCAAQHQASGAARGMSTSAVPCGPR